MPQLSPMSWVLVFFVFFVLLVVMYISIWWMVASSYKLALLNSDVKKISGSVMKWEWSSKKN